MTVEIPFVDKYEPRRLTDFVGQVNIIKKVGPMLEKGTIRNMTFYGETPGVGKTSMAKAIGRKLYGRDYEYCVHDFNASDNSSVEFVRTDLKEITSYAVYGDHDFMLIILDEADGWSNASQNAARRIIEDSGRNCRWILTANKLNKIIPAIQSRCPPIFFAPLPVRDIVSRLQHIAKSEKVGYEQGALHKIAEYSGGSVRDAIKMLDILHFKRRKIMISDIEEGDTGIAKILEMYENAKIGKFVTARNNAIGIMKEFGLSVTTIVSSLEIVVVNDGAINPLQKAKIISNLSRTSLALTSAPSELLQLSGLFADVALIMKNGGK